MQRLSTRIGKHWLLLTHIDECKWHLQVLGVMPLEAEVTAEGEAAAKETAVAATIERLGLVQLCHFPKWNPVITRSWDSRGGTPTGRGGSG